MSGLPDVVETRSLSKSGLSQVTVVFDDHVNIYFARQLVLERLQTAKEQFRRSLRLNPSWGRSARDLVRSINTWLPVKAKITWN